MPFRFYSLRGHMLSKILKIKLGIRKPRGDVSQSDLLVSLLIIMALTVRIVLILSAVLDPVTRSSLILHNGPLIDSYW